MTDEIEQRIRDRYEDSEWIAGAKRDDEYSDYLVSIDGQCAQFEKVDSGWAITLYAVDDPYELDGTPETIEGACLRAEREIAYDERWRLKHAERRLEEIEKVQEANDDG